MFTKEKFADYDEFVEKLRLQVPADFNFALDVMDETARRMPHAPAMIHIDDQGRRKDYDFAFFARESSRLSNALVSRGIKAKDRVMIILYRRVEFWVAMLALHKIGAVAVPSPSQLTPGDIVYRVNFAGIRCIICENSVSDRVEQALGQCPGLDLLIEAGAEKSGSGWLNYDQLVADMPDAYQPEIKPGADDPLLIFFSSGTTGPPKMV
ncbi:MAG: AMP-binding protein, partial [Desulfonatronovibrionaceae bacterium]